MIKRILVIVIILISFLCLTSVSASDSNSLALNGMEESSFQVQELDDSSFISSSLGNDEESGIDNDDEVFISNDEADADGDSSQGVPVLSTSKRTESSDDSTELELDNDAEKEKVSVGDLVTWIIEAKNNGPNVAKNVKVYDELPEGMEFVRYAATAGTFDSKTGIWDIGDLEVGAKEVLRIVTKALTPGEKINKANLTSDTTSTKPEECYEEEDIEVFENTKQLKSNIKAVSSKMYPAGNPIAVLLVSVLALLIATFKRGY